MEDGKVALRIVFEDDPTTARDEASWRVAAVASDVRGATLSGEADQVSLSILGQTHRVAAVSLSRKVVQNRLGAVRAQLKQDSEAHVLIQRAYGGATERGRSVNIAFLIHDKSTLGIGASRPASRKGVENSFIAGEIEFKNLATAHPRITVSQGNS